MAFGGRGFARGVLHVGGHTGKLVFGDEHRKGVGGIEHVVAELLRQCAAAVLDGSEALTVGASELGTAEHEVAQRIGQHLAPR